MSQQLVRAQATRCAAMRSAAVSFTPVCSIRPLALPSRQQQQISPIFGAFSAQQAPIRAQVQVCRANASEDKLISSTEVPAFIPRDDLMDQMLSWAKIEAAEAGQRNFGMPMTVTPKILKMEDCDMLWGYMVSIYRDGNKVCDILVSFDKEIAQRAEYIGIGEDGFPTNEGRTIEVQGKNFEIWKMGAVPVDEDLRRTIRALCTALAQALNRYYAFGSVFVDDAQ